ncbi:malto-oligosyltrehalose trehalohydrolase [Geobacter sp. DSM 9736]|uniref:malto-oligosyltrehalose trehalohydrolase n=1 Tax=Geobacter sp. DSM 9736 TaxID=1277350 RepID=UPI000B50C109|nr:malto-oligosyltrehalose trehalohydrolase [Geobacter sp. DSM 9736]SNB46865.1 maltooligosyl trehalose hydrolase [Geobacter sp. DSM 9736]
MEHKEERRLPVGAELMRGGVHFRVWAPLRREVEVVLEGGPGARGDVRRISLASEGDGYFSAWCPEAAAGTLYRYRLDREGPYPDPASRFQPEGPHGPSRVVDPAFSWADDGWRGVMRQDAVIYEMHIGTFTPGGTWRSAMEELPALRDLGVTVLEVMPVAEFPGRFGWGYDGVDLFAPSHLYGEPDDFRQFVDHAHTLGLGVILDVVYNHLGPEGNYLKQYSASYFTDRYKTEWGEPVNFDGEGSGPVREFFITNAGYWIGEFHLDGLRLDATQTIFDKSPRHVIACMAERARLAAGERSILLVAENEPQQVMLVRSEEEGGCGLDLVWNDDFHHSAYVALSGHNDAYYSEYLGNPQELVSAVKWGYLYQGQRYFWQGKRRGTPTFGINPASFVSFIQNHDQIANSARGKRLHELTSPGSLRAMTALLLLAPSTPMIFQGQEFAASSPFLYFADLDPDIVRGVRAGRVEFLSQFANIASAEVSDSLDDPAAPATFERSRLKPGERGEHNTVYLLHRDLIRLRRDDPVFRPAAAARIEGAVLGAHTFLIRFFADSGERLLLVNLGRDLRLHPAPEPLLAPPELKMWDTIWSSENPRYDGEGTPRLETDNFWLMPGHSAVVLAPVATGDDHA